MQYIFQYLEGIPPISNLQYQYLEGPKTIFCHAKFMSMIAHVNRDRELITLPAVPTSVLPDAYSTAPRSGLPHRPQHTRRYFLPDVSQSEGT